MIVIVNFDLADLQLLFLVLADFDHIVSVQIFIEVAFNMFSF